LSSSNVTKNRFDATSAPTVNDDVDLGYMVGSRWCDIMAAKSYVCLDNTNGAAVWTETTQSGGSETFTGLSDTPANYTGNSLKFARVNVGETALEFAVEADPTVDTDAEIKAILVDEVTKTGDFTAGRIPKINNASGIIEQGTNTDTDVADAVTKKHSQNTDTDLDATFEATFVKKADTVNVLSDITSAGADIEDAVTKKHTQGTDYSNIVICADYAHPDDAITAISTSNKTLLVTEAEICDTNFTVPANVTVRFERGGKWTINNGITVTFNGQIDAGLWQIFEYTGTGTLAGTPQVREFNPQWWGAKGDGTTDDIIAITNTIAALPTNGGTIRFTYGIYRITSSITINKMCKIIGATTARSATAPVQILKDGDFTGIVVNASGVTIDGIYVRGEAGNGGMGIHIRTFSCTLQNVGVVSQGGVGIHVGSLSAEAEFLNCNYWRMINVSVGGNTSHGIVFDASGMLEANVCAGFAAGVQSNDNGGDGIRLVLCSLNNFEGILTEGNTGVGIHLVAPATNNAFWSPVTEANTGGDFIFDGGSMYNTLTGSLYYGVVDNGYKNFVRAWNHNIHPFGASGLGGLKSIQGNVAASGTLDLALCSQSGHSNVGILIVGNWLVINPGVYDQKVYAFMSMGVSYTATEIGTQVAGGGRTFTLSMPSNGVVRVTNTSDQTTTVVIQFMGTANQD